MTESSQRAEANYKVKQCILKLHDLFHRYYPSRKDLLPDTPLDNSCRICHPQPAFEETSITFQTFWNWYCEIQPAESYSGKTVLFFYKLGILLEKDPDPVLIAMVALDLLHSIRYYSAPSRPLESLRHLIIDIAHRSQFFTTEALPENRSTSPQATTSNATDITTQTVTNTESNTESRDNITTSFADDKEFLDQQFRSSITAFDTTNLVATDDEGSVNSNYGYLSDIVINPDIDQEEGLERSYGLSQLQEEF
jgi:hypothetical protein